MGAREGLELEEVPAAFRIREDGGSCGHDGGQGRQTRVGESTARAIRSAASEMTFSAMTAANSSARPPVSLRTRYWETPTSWAT